MIYIPDDVSDFLSGLSMEDISSLKDMAENIVKDNPALQSMLGSLGGGTDSITGNAKEEPEQAGAGFSIDPGMMLKIGNMMSSFSGTDERISLLLALKPHLSPERQKRTDNAIQILKLLRILPALGDLNLF